VLDDDCVTEMSVHHGRTRQEVKETLAEWRYDYFTATYLLLLNKKCKGRPVRLARPRVLMHRQLVGCVDMFLMCYLTVPSSQYSLYSVSEYKPCKVGKAMHPRAAFWPGLVLSSSLVKFRFNLICIFQQSFQFISIHALLQIKFSALWGLENQNKIAD